jgi:ABC-type nitrate/sulfonate/bicarbonate transport system substrate-binding protein
LDVENDAEVVVVPPSQMVAHLRAGHLDGFCSGEPWNSLAVMSRAGWVVARSAELAPQHVEKVLMVRGDFAERSDEQHVALIAALLESAHFCDEPANREYVAETLALSGYVGTDAEAIRRSMRAVYDYGNGRIEPCPGFNIFARGNASEPDAKKAAWVAQTLVSSGLAAASQLPRGLGAKCFRADIFARARALVKPDAFSSAA